MFERAIKQAKATRRGGEAKVAEVRSGRRPSPAASSAPSRVHLKAPRPPPGRAAPAPAAAAAAPSPLPRRRPQPPAAGGRREAGRGTVSPAARAAPGSRAGQREKAARGCADPRAAPTPPRGSPHPAAPGGDPTHPEAPSGQHGRPPLLPTPPNFPSCAAAAGSAPPPAPAAAEPPGTRGAGSGGGGGGRADPRPSPSAPPPGGSPWAASLRCSRRAGVALGLAHPLPQPSLCSASLCPVGAGRPGGSLSPLCRGHARRPGVPCR